ncbi:hypothetical protein OG689_41635 [Kitasatospora sp. NBC_00240]|uniref:hypothetical protein n=1 Tax=Kitasatospora sp. NBC_00240 TaxID=2903567 RepID=UPI002253F819|nr:hypothetical protein [Kitasatospora sp. NBC_00240]MCX5215660.1 hypothetical protein [Kitasatospora sp. NBC_00240]
MLANDAVSTPADKWRWNAPAPRELAEQRQQMEEFCRTDIGLAAMTGALQGGSSSLFPHVEDAADPIAAAARMLCVQESQRLADARLYFADSETTAAALAAASTPPTEAMTEARLPSPAGLMVFADPIGSYEIGSDGPGGWGAERSPLGFHTPIVAVSWSAWTAHPRRPGSLPVQWVANTVHGRELVEPGARGIWMTFYTACGAAYNTLDPDTEIEVPVVGGRSTAGKMAAALARAYRPELTWDNETVLMLGRRFPSVGSLMGTTGAWAQTVYTAWQLMAQTGEHAWTETEVIPRDRPGRKRDRRAGIPDGDVRVVRLRSTHRPSAEAAAKDLEASDGRMPPRTEYRWEVPPYRSPNRCLNTHLHAEGRCTHEERIIRKHVNGPKGRPVRSVRGPVYVLDTPPAES